MASVTRPGSCTPVKPATAPVEMTRPLAFPTTEWISKTSTVSSVSSGVDLVQAPGAARTARIGVLAQPMAADQRSRRPLNSGLRVATDFVRILLQIGRNRHGLISVRSASQHNSDNVGHALNEVTR
jgi:hypothetical protein